MFITDQPRSSKRILKPPLVHPEQNHIVPSLTRRRTPGERIQDASTGRADRSGGQTRSWWCRRRDRDRDEHPRLSSNAGHRLVVVLVSVLGGNTATRRVSLLDRTFASPFPCNSLVINVFLGCVIPTIELRRH